MIEWFMFGALGFFLGCLLALMLAPPLWNRAVKLTTRKLEATMPMSLAEIQADKDQLRAEFAIELRKVEVALDKAKERAAYELIEANKRRVQMQMLEADLSGVKGQLQESQNANRVLQQTIKRRLPDLDARLKTAKKALAELEMVNAELRNTVASQSEALKIARTTVHNQRADIDRLRTSLESSSSSTRGSAKSDGRAVAESQRLAAELSRAKEELGRAKTSAEENAFLRRELSRLASQIITAAHNQSLQQHSTTLHPEAREDKGEGTAVLHRHGNGASYLSQEEPVAEREAAEVALQYQQEIDDVGEHVYVEAGDDAEHAQKDVYRGEQNPKAGDTKAEAEPEAESEGRTSLAQRFAARRAQQRSEKTKGGSLTRRLRSLVADAPETRG
jgi:hypothetical protein